MGQTLAIWKWRPGWPFRSSSRAIRFILRDRAPLALTRFNVHAIADEIRERFGDGDEAPFSIEVCDFTGHRSNWILLSAGWSTAETTLADICKFCTERGLHIYAF